MRKFIYLLLLVPLFFVPLKRANLGNLLPVEAVALYMDNGQVVLETDTENIGRGDTVAEALEDMKKNTPEVIYLDTAEYLVVSENARDQVEQLRPILSSSVKVCVAEVAGDMQEVAKYLEVHTNLPKLRHWRAEDVTK